MMFDYHSTPDESVYKKQFFLPHIIFIFGCFFIYYYGYMSYTYIK